MSPKPIAYEFEGWRLDLKRRALFGLSDNSRMELTDSEFRLLVLLCASDGDPVERRQFAVNRYGRPVPADNATERAVDVGISRLRNKMQSRTLIKSVRNKGYILAAPVEEIYCDKAPV